MVGRLAFTNFLVARGPADGILTTRASSTEWLTLTFAKGSVYVVTLFIVCAVVIRPATDLKTCHKWVALHASGAYTYGFVRLDLAVSISATSGGDTRVDTFLSHASLCQGAIIVHQTFIFGKKYLIFKKS